MKEVPQHTKEWEEIKREILGANDVACLLNNGYYDKDEIIRDKVNYVQHVFDENTQLLIDRGTRYEPIVRELCGIRNKYKIAEVGLRKHALYNFLSASPDGIHKKTKTLFEFKVRTHLDYKILFKYWIQMQIQMEVFNINKVVYCENLIYEYESKEHYLQDSINTKPRGELLWNNKLYYWKLESYYETIVHRNSEWFKLLSIIKNKSQRHAMHDEQKRAS
jgi:predicted phage-related endonuclease